MTTNKTKKESKVFRVNGANYGELFHAIASTSYNPTLTYYSGNGRVYCLADNYNHDIISVFFLGIKIAEIHKDTEQVFRMPLYTLGNGIDNVLCYLNRAFDHFNKIVVSTFNAEEALELMMLHKDRDFPANKLITTGLECLLDTLSTHNIPTEELRTVSKAIETQKYNAKRLKEGREAAEKKRQEKILEEVKALTPFITSVFNKIEGNYNKIRSYKRFELKYKDIPDELKQHFIVDNSNDDNSLVTFKHSYYHLYEDCIGVRKIKRYYYSDSLHIPDGITLIGDTLLTTQGCKVQANTPDFKLLYKALVHKIKQRQDCSEFYGDDVGNYQLREVNYSQEFIRVGCHCFLFEDVLALEDKINNL